MNVFGGLLLLLIGFVCFRWPAAPFQISMVFDESALSDGAAELIRRLGALCMILGAGISAAGLATTDLGI